MRCNVCNGSGVRAIPHIPAATGSWPFKLYLPSEDECGECEGRGDVDHSSTGEEEAYIVDLRGQSIGEFLGTITAYHLGRETASILLDGVLHCGDRIMVVDESGALELEIEWMQWGKAWIHLALRGWMVTFPSNERLQAGAKVYRIA